MQTLEINPVQSEPDPSDFRNFLAYVPPAFPMRGAGADLLTRAEALQRYPQFFEVAVGEVPVGENLEDQAEEGEESSPGFTMVAAPDEVKAAIAMILYTTSNSMLGIDHDDPGAVYAYVRPTGSKEWTELAFSTDYVLRANPAT